MFQTISRIWRCPPIPIRKITFGGPARHLLNNTLAPFFPTPGRKHRCSQGSHPQQPCVLVPRCMLSEYQEKYPAHCATAVRATKKMKNEYQPLEGKISNMTTSKSDYVAHEVNQRPAKVVKGFVPAEGRMRHTSSYTRDYPNRSVQERNISTKSEEYHPPTEKMVAQSVYKEEFRAWHNQKVQPYRTCDNLNLNDGKFEGTTIFQQDYGNKGLAEARGSFKPLPDRRESLPFDGTTNYHTEYVSHPVQPRQPREKVPHRPSTAPLNGVSTYRHDYRGLPTEPVKPFRAEVAWERSPAVFQGISECRDQYKAWPLQPKHQAEECRTPQGTVVGLCRQRPSAARPPAQPCTKEIPPRSISTMKEDYRAWDMVPHPPAVFADGLEKPEGAFAGSTTFRSAYTPPKTARHAVSFKPTQTTGEDSVNRSANETKEIAFGPARGGCPPGFEYDSMGAGGHRLYRAVSVPETGPSQQATGDKAFCSHGRKSCMFPRQAKRAP